MSGPEYWNYSGQFIGIRELEGQAPQLQKVPVPLILGGTLQSSDQGTQENLIEAQLASRGDLLHQR